MHTKKAQKLAAAAMALLLFALAGCGQQPMGTGQTPNPSATLDPATPESKDNTQKDELERLALPEGYTPLAAPAPVGITEQGIRHFEYEDLADAALPAFDLSALPDRLWPQGDYETEQRDKSQTFTLVGEDSQKELLYWDDHYAMYQAYDPEHPALTTGAEDLQRRTRERLSSLLGSDAYFGRPQQMDDTFHQRNLIEAEENSLTFIWDQVVDGIPAEGRRLTAVAGEEGLSSFTLHWGVFEPTGSPLPDRLLTADEALYSLNYARSQASQSAMLPRLNRIIHAELVLSPRFAERPTLFRPAWKFVLVNEQNNQEVDTVLVDVATGDLFSDHDGWMGSAYPALASRSLEMAASGLDHAIAETMLKEYVETAWSSLHTLTVPQLPSFAMENVENVFNYLWSEYRIELIRRKAPQEQAKTPPVASIRIGDMSVDGIRVRVPYECDVQIDREQGDAQVSFFDNAVFVFRDGRWMLEGAGLIWNGETYADTYFGIRHDGPLSGAEEAVRRQMERLDAPDSFAPGESEPGC